MLKYTVLEAEDTERKSGEMTNRHISPRIKEKMNESYRLVYLKHKEKEILAEAEKVFKMDPLNVAIANNIR